jgi:hypothetical protein
VGFVTVHVCTNGIYLFVFTSPENCNLSLKDVGGFKFLYN